jgi:phage-related protein
VRTPPFSKNARVEVGKLLGGLQRGDMLSFPHSRPMPSIGKHCHELRVVDTGASWRIVYRIDSDAVVVLAVFRKTTRTTPNRVIADCKRRLRAYDAAAREE